MDRDNTCIMYRNNLTTAQKISNAVFAKAMQFCQIQENKNKMSASDKEFCTTFIKDMKDLSQHYSGWKDVERAMIERAKTCANYYTSLCDDKFYKYCQRQINKEMANEPYDKELTLAEKDFMKCTKSVKSVSIVFNFLNELFAEEYNNCRLTTKFSEIEKQDCFKYANNLYASQKTDNKTLLF